MQAAYEVLNVLDFTSERGRMSIIVRARLRPEMDAGTMDQTHTNLHVFSVKGCSPLPWFHL